jgi:hypothetical protein
MSMCMRKTNPRGKNINNGKYGGEFCIVPSLPRRNKAVSMNSLHRWVEDAWSAQSEHRMIVVGKRGATNKMLSCELGSGTALMG